MKKVLALALAAIMITAAFTGCDNGSTSIGDSTSVKESSTDSSTVSDADSSTQSESSAA